MAQIHVLQIGLGPLGIKTAQYIDQRPSITTVAAVDKNPNLIGKSLSILAKIDNDIVIQESIEQAIDGKNVDVAILTTVSDVERITPQIEEIASFGIPIVTTCEELSYPYHTAPKLSKRIDAAAKENNIAVVATGVNPGFLMDALPVYLTSVCQDVKSIKVKRFQNAEFRRLPFQKKIGAGTTIEDFEKRIKDGSLRHVGLTESMHLIASRMGWKLDSTEDKIMPVIADKDIITKDQNIKKGMASGVRQLGIGQSNGKTLITLEFQAAVGEAESFDEVIIEGTPNIRSKIEGGVNGDVATCAIVLNTVPGILKANPGLYTVDQLALSSFFK